VTGDRPAGQGNDGFEREPRSARIRSAPRAERERAGSMADRAGGDAGRERGPAVGGGREPDPSRPPARSWTRSSRRPSRTSASPGRS
jgi:hypothetical protein